jgi:uncharacterized protein DUF4962/heparinase II/III-like protein
MPRTPASHPRRADACVALLVASAIAAPAFAEVPKHPFLFFSADDLPALRRKCESEPFATRFRTLLVNADGFLQRPLRARRAGRMPNSRGALGRIGTLAFAYAMTEDRKYGLRAKEDMIALMSASAWHRRAAGSTTQLATGEASVAFALFYDWCHDLLTDAEKAEMRERFLTLSTRVYMDSIEKRQWWVNNPVTNWCGVLNGGCGLGALAIAGESPEAARAAQIALEHTRAFLRSVTLQDGGGHEGVMYWRYGVNFGNYFTFAASRIQGDDAGLYADWTAKCVGYWDIYMQGTDGNYANFNNMHENVYQGLYSENDRAEAGPDAPLHALLESKVPGGDPLLLWAADHGGAKFYWRGTSPFWFIWRRETPPAPQRPALDPAVLFRGCGHAIFQSPSLWLAYNGGWTSDKSHSNSDLGTFVLVADGQRMVNDPGYGKSSTAEHSSILVNGRGQPRNVRGQYLRFGSGERFHYLASDLTQTYGPGVLERFVRHLVMVDGRYVVVLDELACAESTRFEWRLQTRRSIDAKEGTTQAVLRGEQTNLHVISVAPGSAVADVGKATLPFLRFQPVEPVDKTTFLTILFPAAGPDAPPSVRFDKTQGVLTVRDAQGRTDRLQFGDEGLVSVNDHSASEIGPPGERTFTVYRQGAAR